MVFTAIVLALAGAVVLWLSFRYYPEKKAAEHLFDALVAGNTSQAYQLWKATPSYTEREFLADWGPNGYYGPVKSYSILHAKSPRGANGVFVTVAVSPFTPMPGKEEMEKSQRTKVISLWIKSDDKSFSFPPTF